MIRIGGLLKVGRCILDQLNIFVMSTEGFARSMMLEWIEKETYNYRAFTINIQRFGANDRILRGFNDVVETSLLTTSSPDRQPGARDDGFR
jgi:hypothetical protein